MEIILASASIGRKRVLKNLGLKFTIIPADIDEGKITTTNPITLAKKIAKAKALAVLAKIYGKGRRATILERRLMLKPSPKSAYVLCPKLKLQNDWRQWKNSLPPAQSNYLIIAADSMVVFQGKTYGKPKSREEAASFLQMFSGKTHEFLTGLCIISTKTNKMYQSSEKSKVVFARLTKKEIEDYVAAAPVILFAGAYSLEEAGAEILKPKIKFFGSKTNVLGLPVEKLIPILKKEGVSIPKSHLG